MFRDLWIAAPLGDGNGALTDIYGVEAVALLSQDIGSANRWAIGREQGPLLSTLYEDLLFSPLLQDMLSGYFNSSETIIEMYLAAVDAIPGYNYPVQVAPSPTP
jgi:hypothetical protein